MRVFILILAILGIGQLLGGCAAQMPASVGGECRLFHDPGFAVRGKRVQDSRWIGATQEVGIQACGWKRPAK